MMSKRPTHEPWPLLSLDDRRWHALRDAEGGAGQLPGLLGRLSARGSLESESEVWQELWSRLASGAVVTNAAYAALPHIILAAAARPAEGRLPLLALGAKIAALAAAARSGPPPPDLGIGFDLAVSRGESLCLEILLRPFPDSDYRVLLGALAAFQGHPVTGINLLEQPEPIICPHCGDAFDSIGASLIFAG
jgi:hypothetical protein